MEWIRGLRDERLGRKGELIDMKINEARAVRVVKGIV
jgi:hypothetical protein